MRRPTPGLPCSCGRRLIDHGRYPDPKLLPPFRRAEDLRLLAEMEGEAVRVVVSDWTRETTR